MNITKAIKRLEAIRELYGTDLELLIFGGNGNYDYCAIDIDYFKIKEKDLPEEYKLPKGTPIVRVKIV